MDQERTYVYCNRCGGDTWHLIVGQRRKESGAQVEDGYAISFVEKSEFIECQVCQQTRIRVTQWNSENDVDSIVFHPPASKHKAPPWLRELPPEYRYLALEIYSALDAESYSLALMGARALLDVYVSRHTDVPNDFRKKLDDLCKQGALSAKHAEILWPAFDAGSAAAHRGYRPSECNVITAVQVVENLIQQEVLGEQTQKLQAETPRRQR